MKTIFLALSVLLALTGCAVKPEIRYVPKVETVTVVLSPPKALYSPVKHIKPPNVNEYVEASWDVKEKILFDHISRLDTQIESFMIDRSATGTWLVEQKANTLGKQ